jgi:hypothetical protein
MGTAVRGGSVVGYRVPVPDAATTTWVNAVIAGGGTVSSTRQDLVNGLIVGLKTDGVWLKLDRLWLFAGENQPSALIDIIAVSLATAVNSPTFTTDRGYTGVAAGGLSASVYIASGYNPTTNNVAFAQNSAHMSHWNITGGTPAAGGAIMGIVDGVGTSFTQTLEPFSDANHYFRINEGGSGSITAPAGTTGHFISNRSGAAASQAYRNGSSFASPNTTSVAAANGPMAILATWNLASSAPVDSTDRQIAMVSIGGSLSSTDATNFYTHLRTYMTAVGVP